MSAAQLASLWDDKKAAGMSEAERLVYRSNLFGSDLRITNFGGGNTSSKIMEKDPLTGEDAEVMWVKGSGGDLGTIKLDGFSTLYMDRLHALKKLYRGVAFEDEMVGFLPHCTFNLNPRAASIDTPLHAFVPRKFVDHMHPDAIIAIAASKDSKALTAEIFGGEIGWLPWKRPGFELGLWLEKYCVENPKAIGVVLESHGLFTWGDTPKDCYETTLRIISRAMEWLDEKTKGKPAFGGAKHKALPEAERKADCPQADAGHPGPDQRNARRRPDISTTAPPCWSLSAPSASKSLPRLAHRVLTISCAPKSARSSSALIPPSRTWTRPLRGLKRTSLPTATAMPPITIPADTPIPPPCAIRTPWSI